MRGWKVIKNLLLLWKYFYLMKRCEKEIKDYGMVTMSILDELTEEEQEGVRSMVGLYLILRMNPADLKKDFKILERRVMRWDKKN